ncbi:MAG: alanine--glyoxylate aminotransferase family protein, partial [Sulfolobaceae archaeon]
MLLLIPGPVNVPTSVLEYSKIVVNHRSEEFKKVVKELEDNLVKILGAERVGLLSGSGTLAVEAMVYSLTKRGQKVIGISYGDFGDRMIESMKRRGLKVVELRKKMGEDINLEEVKKVIDENKDAELLALVHNETSTGIALRNLREFVNIGKRNGLGVLVDSVSGMFAYEILINKWKVDAVASASQKALASIPGLAIIAVSDEGLNRLNNYDVPTYLDLKLHLDFQIRNETPFTPNISAFYATYRAVELLLLEGINRRIRRHESCSRLLRKILEKFNFSLLGNENNFSNTVVAAFPYKYSPSELILKLREFNIEIAKGMGELREKIVRFGVLGM